MTTLFLVIALFVLLALGMPISISIGLSSVLTALLFTPTSLASIALKFFATMEHYTLMSIPFFILASGYMTSGGIARRTASSISS